MTHITNTTRVITLTMAAGEIRVWKSSEDEEDRVIIGRALARSIPIAMPVRLEELA